MTDRSNDEWLTDLQAEGTTRTAALEDLREHLRRGLFYYLRRERSDLSDRTNEEIQQMAEDFVQDALLKVLDNIETFRGESRFTTWASKIAVRVAISELRRVRWKDYSLDSISNDGEFMPRLAADASASSVTPPDPINPEQATEQQNVFKLIEQAIDEALTERQREAMIALAIDGIPVPELARVMGTNANALYKLMHDARLKLRTHLEERGIDVDYVMQLFGSD